MKQIDCGHGCFAIVDDEDFERLKDIPWRAHLHNRDRGPKAHRRPVRFFRENGKKRLVYLYHEILPKRDGFVIDHINGNVWDNRRCNLRYATPGENVRNQARITNSWGFKGVSKKRQRFFAHITVDGQSFWTRGHETPEAAARAYDALALVHHGEFARLNFPISGVR